MSATWKWSVLFLMILMTGTVGLTFAQTAEDAPVEEKPKDVPTPSNFTYELPKAGLTSAGVYDDKGRLVRVLWQATTMDAGKHNATWDGMTDFKEVASPGKYEVRVALNEVAEYKNVAIIGNTSHTREGHIQHNIGDMCVDEAGRIFTANGWEEDGHDFKVFNADGTTAFHARYQIRNGRPNGAPYAIAVDDKFLYVAMEGWSNDNDRNKQQIQRFTVDKGDHVAFTDESLKDTFGHIEIYEWPAKLIPEGTPEEDAAMMRYPLQAIAVRGDEILCADTLGGKIHRFDKVTGLKTGEFEVKLPHALAVDAKGQLWVGHEHSKVSVFTIEGKLLGTPITDAKHVKALKTGSGGTRLVLTDSKANAARVYELDGAKAKFVSTFGSTAKPGDSAPDRFYRLTCAVMDANGGLITSQVLPTAGLRLARFDAKGKLVWEQMGLEFCSIGNYGRHNPDEMITQLMHRIKLDRKNSTWTYDGTILAGDPKYVRWPHGVPRILMIEGKEFFFQSYGDGMQVYRRDKDGLLHLASLVGGVNPQPDGTYNDIAPPEKRAKGQGKWSWSDVNGDGVVSEKGLTTFKEFGAPGVGYAVFGLNVDADGHILFCDHHLWGISELPRSGVDKNGNPTYDWSKEKLLVKRDESKAKFFPLMAVRSADGSIYAIGRANEDSVFERATRTYDGWMWMGGELLAKYDKDGERQWVIRLPHKCTGLDVVPDVGDGKSGGRDRGVATGYFEFGVVYQINPDGLVVGTSKPGDAAGNVTGWLDTTGSVAVNRDKGGILDFFIEDSLLNRFIWHRGDDRNIKTIKVAVERK